MEQAADEIEDQRSENKRLFDMITKQRYEIERLRAEVQAWKELAQELTMYAAMQEMTEGHDGFA